jgi:nitrate/nitrite-specific signal transduction histidine kinase
MKLIKVYGCSQNLNRKDLVRRAAVYFLSRLLPRKRNIQISIRVEDNLIENDSMYGGCYHMSKSPSKYKIRLDSSMSDYTLISTLAHEFVHVRQFDENELIFTDSYSQWRGKYYQTDEFAETEEPWEVEPRKMESVLAAEFFS